MFMRRLRNTSDFSNPDHGPAVCAGTRQKLGTIPLIRTVRSYEIWNATLGSLTHNFLENSRCTQSSSVWRWP
jgi:hypothetical protein